MQCSVRDFSSWIDYRHYPIMTVTQIHAYGGKLTQNLNMSYGKCRMSTYKYAKLYLLRSTLTELTPQEPSLYSQYNIDNRVTVIDILHGGYYRVKYDGRTWDQIAKYLNSLAYKNISAINP
ncbi:PREDICTED: uncharacterized protein LOC105567968 [Vollenhovia emeryi]|uniref:uncharacterized protein LOC105567968 n=1 Tax=Vollenhovia emeryi TaxID=411798 RepID=UPI0005F50A6C|nr:PREDICTED: uncharacterized protein LOC105567968 [Vollenhovia emeryi]